MNKLIKSSICALAIGFLAIFPAIASAQEDVTQNITGRLNTIAGFSGYETGATALTVPQIIGTIIRVALSFLGVIFLGLMIMGGYNWMTASGNEDTIKKAKGTIKSAIIGLIVVLFSYSIWLFIFQKFILGK